VLLVRLQYGESNYKTKKIVLWKLLRNFIIDIGTNILRTEASQFAMLFDNTL